MSCNPSRLTGVEGLYSKVAPCCLPSFARRGVVHHRSLKYFAPVALRAWSIARRTLLKKATAVSRLSIFPQMNALSVLIVLPVAKPVLYLDHLKNLSGHIRLSMPAGAGQIIASTE